MYTIPDGYRFHTLPQVSSTNMYAMEQAHAGLAVNGDVFFALEQTNGKGQRGKSWHAAPGQNILMSLLLDCAKLAPSQSFRLSAVVALACRQLLQTLLNEPIFIKWPNDVYINDRKAVGILIENVISSGSWKWAIVGIGINVNQREFSPDLPIATSVAIHNQQNYDCSLLAQQLCGMIEEGWQRLLAGHWQQILEEYNQALFGRNEIKRLRKDNMVTPCLIRRVTEQGILLAGENEEWRFEHGEVEWVR